MKQRIVCVAIVCVLCAASLCAEDLTVSYVDGNAEARIAGSWAGLTAGDTVAGDATVRITGSGIIELKTGALTIVLSRPGAYSLKTILAARRAEPSKKVTSSISRSFAALTAQPRLERNAASGVRSEKIETGEFDWVTEDSAEYLERARDNLAAGDTAAALAQLDLAQKEAQREAQAKELREIGYYRASAYAIQGRTRQALVALAGVSPGPDDSWARDYGLLEARLLLESAAPRDAVELLTADATGLAADSRRAPLYWFLLTVGWHDLGDNQRARAALDQLSALGTDDGLAASAAELLRGP